MNKIEELEKEVNNLKEYIKYIIDYLESYKNMTNINGNLVKEDTYIKKLVLKK